MPTYERGDVTIYYEEAGSGFPVLVMPGGGLNSQSSWWPRMPFDAMEVFKGDFRVITMDQRNAIGGKSTGPVQIDDPWGAFADDQIGLMDHLGISEFMALGCCIGGPFVLKIAERVPRTTQVSPRAAASQARVRSPSARPECSTCTGTPRRSRKRRSSCGVRPISGTSTSTWRPCASTRSLSAR